MKSYKLLQNYLGYLRTFAMKTGTPIITATQKEARNDCFKKRRTSKEST